MADNTIYAFYHEDHGEISCTRSQLSAAYLLKKSNLGEVINFKRRAEQGWIMLETWSNERTMEDACNFYLQRKTLAKAYRRYLSESVHNKVITGKKWMTDIEVTSQFAPILREMCPRC